MIVLGLESGQSFFFLVFLLTDSIVPMSVPVCLVLIEGLERGLIRCDRQSQTAALVLPVCRDFFFFLLVVILRVHLKTEIGHSSAKDRNRS